MFKGKNEIEARKEILNIVKNYYEVYHNKTEYKKGDRISYSARVYDSEEMCNLVDSSLEFWLTSGRYTDKFEKEFASYLNVRYCSIVNSGSITSSIRSRPTCANHSLKGSAFFDGID